MARDGHLARYFDETCNKTGLPQSWLDVRQQMVDHGILAMPAVYQWHCTEGTPMLGAQLNYHLTLQYFEAELDNIKNRNAREALKKQFEKRAALEAKLAKAETELLMAQYKSRFAPEEPVDDMKNLVLQE